MRIRLVPILLSAVVTLAVPALSGAQVLRNFQLLAHKDEYYLGPTADSYSACWSYIHGDGREYAIIGTNGGTAIYNVTNPATTYRVGLIPGPPSLWREMKSYRNWIYIVTEGVGTGAGLQIVSMVNPEAPVLVRTETSFFLRAHTVAVDTSRAILIANGTRNSSGLATGMRILSLANPELPVELGWWPGGSIPVPQSLYIHDSVPIGNRLYASSVYAGTEYVFDFTNPAVPVQLASWTYPGGFTHNSWPDATGQVLYVTDEVNGEPLKIFDIANLAAPVLRNAITSNPQAIVHNAHVKGSELYLSNYTEGIRALDISDPLHPAEFAYADSWPGVSGDYWGVWEVCPYFPSGIVIASDMQTGLYVYRPNRTYGLLRLRVIDGATGLPMVGAKVRMVTQGDSLTTPADGIVQFAPNPGSHTARVTQFGWYDGVVTRPIASGVLDSVTIVMQPRPRFDVSGVVRDVALAPLPDAQVMLEGMPTHSHTSPSGQYLLSQVPDGDYGMSVRRPGYVPLVFTRRVGANYPLNTDYKLAEGTQYDALESNLGWTVGAAGDNATGGLWTRVDPLGTSITYGGATAARARGADPLAMSREPAGVFHEGHEGDGATPGQVQPENDRTPGTGTMCFVTGQGTNPTDIAEADVDGGKTSLVSPALNTTGMPDPMIGFWYWFYTGSPSTKDDYLRVYLSANGGASWTLAQQINGLHNHWEEASIRVGAYVSPTATLKVKFVAADSASQGVVEAGIDDLELYAYGTATAGVEGRAPLSLRTPWPNPAAGDVTFALDLPADGALVVDVVDIAGRVVRSLRSGHVLAGTHTMTWNGADDRGRRTAPGLYFARARFGAEERIARIVRVE